VAVPTQQATPVFKPGHGAHTKSQPELEDTYLVAMAKDGHSDAYDQIIRRYRGFVRLEASRSSASRARSSRP
jgi:hypothetical protein